MNRMQHTRPCAGCGKMMYNVSNRRKYCPECCRNRHNASNRKWWASGTRTEQRHRALWKANAEGRHDALLADVRAAEQAWLSYGKYMLTKNKKPSGVTSTGEPAKG
nr:MAG TPA: PhnA Zinc-Ribbon [Caudoviricetes sp.]